MKTISVLKKDMEFNRGLASLIEVLKNIAVSQYRSLEQKMKTFEQLQRSIESFFDFIDFSQVEHPFLRSHDKPQIVVAITSDSGLLGGLNMQVVNAAMAELERTPGIMVVIGERGKMYASESKTEFISFPGIRDDQRYEEAMQIRDYVMDKIMSNEFGNLQVIYPHPISFTVQRVEKITFLPFAPIGKAPATAPSEAPASAGLAAAGAVKDIIIESRLEDVLEYLVYIWVGQRLYEIFGFSRLAEFAARYVHLEESLQKLKSMDTTLRLQYFRVRHEIIDRNMRELFSARLMYGS